MTLPVAFHNLSESDFPLRIKLLADDATVLWDSGVVAGPGVLRVPPTSGVARITVAYGDGRVFVTDGDGTRLVE